MSRARSKRPAHRARARKPAPRRLRLAGSIAIACCVLGAAGAGWFMRGRSGPVASDRAVAPTPWGDLPAGVSPTAAYDQGAKLTRETRYAEALPWLWSAAQSNRATWFVHSDYAGALHQYAMLPWNADHPRVAPRGSFERVRAMKRSHDAFETAAALLPGANERAELLWTRARIMNTWGMPWDALQGFRDAAALDGALASNADRYAASLLDPLQSGDLW